MTVEKEAEVPRHGMTAAQIAEVQARYGVGPHMAADLVVFSLRWDGAVPAPMMLLIERKHPPYAGRLACPGGFVELDEDLEVAARRELAEETGLTGLAPAHLEQLGTYGHPSRDPRGRVISVVFLAIVPWSRLERPSAGDDAADAKFHVLCDGVPVDGSGAPRELAFDHERVLADAFERIAELARTTSLPLSLLPERFTAVQAARAWQLLSAEPVDPTRLIERLHAAGWIEPVEPEGEEGPERAWRASSESIVKAVSWWRT